MADAFPQTHSTRAGVTTTSRPSIHVDEWRSLPGLVKIAQIVFTVILFIIAVASFCINGWHVFLSIAGFIVAAITFVALLTHFRQKASSNFPILLIELIVYVVLTILFFITAIVLAVQASGYFCRAAAGFGSFFAFLITIACGLDAYLLFSQWRGRSSLPGTTSSGIA